MDNNDMDNNDMDNNEIIVGYRDLCRSYERNHYGEVLSKMNRKHFTACKSTNCIHPVFYIVSHDDKQMIPFTVNIIERNIKEDGETLDALDDFE